MILKALTLSDLQTAREWRNQLMPAWRTPYMLTEKMQQEFYENVISDRRANLRYWGFHEKELYIRTDRHQDEGDCETERYEFVGYGGIENICWESRTGEISLLIDPDLRGKGYGAAALTLILSQAFNVLNLGVVHAECYTCNDSLKFWEKMGEKYNAEVYELPYRKFWDGVIWPAKFFYFTKAKCEIIG